MSPMTTATLELIASLPEPIIEDDWDINERGHGTGPKLGCLSCQSDVRTEVVASPRLYRRYSISGPIHVLTCPDCCSDITEAFSL